MKGESWSADDWIEFDLYIPHGSDESSETQFTVRHECILYIPHGSDERLQ